MTRFRSAICLLSMLLLAGLLPPAADAQELSAKEIKRLQKQAGKDFAAGRLEQAVETYEQILAATVAGDSQRSEALYAISVAQLAPENEARRPLAARRHLDELASSFPRHPRRLEIAALRGLLYDLEAARSKLAQAAETMAEQEAAFAAERERIAAEREEIAGESEAAGGRVKSLEGQLRKTRSELDETRQELAAKEEALQKLKEALVGRAGGG